MPPQPRNTSNRSKNTQVKVPTQNDPQPSNSTIATRSQNKKDESTDDSPQEVAETQLTSTATSVTSKFGTMLSQMIDLVNDVKKEGTIAEKVHVISLLRDVHNSSTAATVVQTGKICAENIARKLQVKTGCNNILLNDPTIASSATEYKLTFKKKSGVSEEIVDPLEEIYNATEDLEVQISDTYVTLNGHVVCLQNKCMFLATRAAIEDHRVTKESLKMSEYFDISEQISSAYAIKTAAFEKAYLTKYDLLFTENGRESLKIEQTTSFLHKYNKGWFSTPDDIENVECFGLNKTNNSKLTLKIHVSHDSFRKFVHSIKTNIMLRQHRIRIYEQVNVVQCLKCCKFKHVAKFCTAEQPKCRFCGSSNTGENGHVSKDCPYRSTPKCCNCIEEYGEENTADHPINHSASSFVCPLLRLEQDQIRAEIKRKATSSYTYN